MSREEALLELQAQEVAAAVARHDAQVWPWWILAAQAMLAFGAARLALAADNSFFVYEIAPSLFSAQLYALLEGPLLYFLAALAVLWGGYLSYRGKMPARLLRASGSSKPQIRRFQVGEHAKPKNRNLAPCKLASFPSTPS